MISRQCRLRTGGWFSLLLLLLLSVSSAFARCGDVVPGEILLSLSCRSTSGPRVTAAVDGLGDVAAASSRLGVCRLRLRPGVSLEQAIARLKARHGVSFVEPNIEYSVETESEADGPLPPDFFPNDPGFALQYAPRLIGADRAWEIFQPKATVIVAIVDSGIDASHPDLTDAVLRSESGIFGYDALLHRPDNAYDEYYHGTHCAGIVAARVNNGVGVAGIAGVADSGFSAIKLMPVKVFDRLGRGSSYSVSEGIVWAADHGARVISLSLGSPLYSASVARAVSYAQEKGSLVVAAAGNWATSIASFPAALPGVLAVAATDSEDQLASYSNYGAWVPVAAPGDRILSTTPTRPTPGRVARFYDVLSGTSMACPHVAAEAALLMAQNPTLSASEVARLILTHVDPYRSNAERALAPGAGRINIQRALAAASGEEAPASSGPSVTLAALTLDPARVEGGRTVTATVSLSGPSPAGADAPMPDVALTLSTDAPGLVTLPAEVVIPMGSTGSGPGGAPSHSASVSFPVTTARVSTLTTVRFSAAALGAEVGATLILEPEVGVVTGLVVEPATLTGGAATRVTVTVSRPAPAGGTRVSLASDQPDRLNLPGSVVVPAGATRASASIVTRAVGCETPLEVGASLGGATETAALTLLPPAVQTVLVRPNVSRINRLINVTVTLEGPAPAGGMLLHLTSDRPDLIDAPATIAVPAGARDVTFPLMAQPAPVQTPVQISVGSAGGARTGTLTILPIFTGASAVTAR